MILSYWETGNRTVTSVPPPSAFSKISSPLCIATISSQTARPMPVPLALDGVGYKYAHDYKNHYVKQQYLPYELTGSEFYSPTGNGYEVKIREHMKRIKSEAEE